MTDHARDYQPTMHYPMTNDELQRAIDSAAAFTLRIGSGPVVAEHLRKLLSIQAARAAAVCVDGCIQGGAHD